MTFTLSQRKLEICASGGAFTQKLSYRANLLKGEDLRSHDGTQVDVGYVEFAFEPPRHETEKLWFHYPTEDSDTGKKEPPSVSFYGLVPVDIFALLRDCDPRADHILRIHTGLLGAIRYADSLGFSREWDTSQQNPVAVDSYAVVLGSDRHDV